MPVIRLKTNFLKTRKTFFWLHRNPKYKVSVKLFHSKFVSTTSSTRRHVSCCCSPVFKLKTLLRFLQRAFFWKQRYQLYLPVI